MTTQQDGPGITAGHSELAIFIDMSHETHWLVKLLEELDEIRKALERLNARREWVGIGCKASIRASTRPTLRCDDVTGGIPIAWRRSGGTFSDLGGTHHEGWAIVFEMSGGELQFDRRLLPWLRHITGGLPMKRVELIGAHGANQRAVDGSSDRMRNVVYGWVCARLEEQVTTHPAA